MRQQALAFGHRLEHAISLSESGRYRRRRCTQFGRTERATRRRQQCDEVRVRELRRVEARAGQNRLNSPRQPLRLHTRQCRTLGLDQALVGAIVVAKPPTQPSGRVGFQIARFPEPERAGVTSGHHLLARHCQHAVQVQVALAGDCDQVVEARVDYGAEQHGLIREVPVQRAGGDAHCLGDLGHRHVAVATLNDQLPERPPRSGLYDLWAAGGPQCG